ncbi:hypothetical protein BPT24_181 [Tenacibaculum phage pT24]|uniref:Uncharacterized protein n=1 Tax=Tenacibaculum phage pT24 TaxID=1880590 RepID=A0A1B4XWW5_9CAUD|nr:hypothetical protein HYP10_gp181 [Tenacibaculum phage pT24]BAV39306.1 hypothetical protein BPT24_181 [Tenacibaculum phage pT24]
MDILKRKLLNVGESCYFFVSSVEDPYDYIRMKGVIEEVHSVKDEQVVYRIRLTNIFENGDVINTYMNRNSYRGFDLKRKVNRTRLMYSFDCKSVVEFIENKLEDFLFEASSAMVFPNREEMEKEYKSICNYIYEYLHEIMERNKKRGS